MLASLLNKVAYRLRRLSNRLSRSPEWQETLDRWRAGDAAHNHRLNYPELTPGSVVFDLGGYRGQWASDIFGRYCCTVYVFEPHPTFATKIKERFHRNQSIHVFAFGLGDKAETLQLSTAADASTAFGEGGERVAAPIREVNQFLEKHGVETIDLMKINIEGGEYALLKHLITTGTVQRIKNIQVQFHNFVPGADAMMEALHKQLRLTHEPTYQYRYLWENWVLR
ncbi:MAG: FkbM family methyltransferase [Bacteroidota bacterium]